MYSHREASILIGTECTKAVCLTENDGYVVRQLVVLPVSVGALLEDMFVHDDPRVAQLGLALLWQLALAGSVPLVGHRLDKVLGGRQVHKALGLLILVVAVQLLEQNLCQKGNIHFKSMPFDTSFLFKYIALQSCWDT